MAIFSLIDFKLLKINKIALSSQAILGFGMVLAKYPDGTAE